MLTELYHLMYFIPSFCFPGSYLASAVRSMLTETLMKMLDTGVSFEKWDSDLIFGKVL